MHGQKPGRFKFALTDDYEFNHSIIIDVMYIDGKPVLQVIDASTSFGAAKFLNDMSTSTVWDTLWYCWIDTYQGPPDQIVHDAGTNFASRDFRQLAQLMSISTKEVPVEAHNSIGKVERYHTPLRRAYNIIQDELKGEKISKDMILQMAQKAVNDSAGPDGIVPTLLVFGAYPRMTNLDAPSPSIAKRANAISKATKEVRRLYAKRQVRDALAMRNGPNTRFTLDLPINSLVRVWREKEGWKGPYKLLATEGEACTIELPHGPVVFRSTVVKPYYTEENQETSETPLAQDHSNQIETPQETDTNQRYPTRTRALPRRFQLLAEQEIFQYDLDAIMFESESLDMAWVTNKEKADLELALELRKEGKITAPGASFEHSQRLEIEGLISRGVFEFVKFNAKEHSGVRVFKSRLINEVKCKATSAPFEKSRLVIQAYNDEGKEIILTQAPTIQRASQRLIAALGPSIFKLGFIKLYLRDVKQAYINSTTTLNRLIIAKLPRELEKLYPPTTVMIVRRPLYGIAESGTHWWSTYNNHHREKLLMIPSTYDPCLLHTMPQTSNDVFGVVGMQIDDTLILCDNKFANREDMELQRANIPAKPRESLSCQTPLAFNGCLISLSESGEIILRQKGQANNIKLVVGKENARIDYRAQRARGAYIASVCQPEACFDLSVAAQHQDPKAQDIEALNKRLNWQMKNQDRGLKYIPIDLATAKLFVFVDGSFANNRDLSSQIGYIIILANEENSKTNGEYNFYITGNVVHYSSTKCKRVTRSVLASEIYGMVSGVDMAISIGSTLNMILKGLKLNPVPIVVCTDSYSLYDCLVKLGSTKEKRLMIDIMALRQSYERRELAEVRWINGDDNPADSMTKSNPNKALKNFVDANRIKVRVDGWVTRR